MGESISEHTQINPNTSKYPDPRLWLSAGAKKEVFQTEGVMRLNILGGYDSSDTLGALKTSRAFETGKNGEIILHFSATDNSEKRQGYIQNTITEYFAHVFRTSILHMGISGKYQLAGKGEQDIGLLAKLPIFDTSGDTSQRTESFYNIMRSDELLIVPKERERIVSYLDFLGDVSGLASRIILGSIQLDKVASITLHPAGIMIITLSDGSTKTHNLLDIYTAAKSPSSLEQKRKLDEARKKREEFRESLDTESLFDGKIIVTYAHSMALTAYTGMEGYDALTRKHGTRGVLSSLHQQSGERLIKKIVIQTSEGARILTDLDLQGNKIQIKENLFRELRKYGIQFDPKSGKFIQPEIQALRSSLQRSLEEVRTITKQPNLTQKELNSMKQSLESIENEAIRANKPVHKIFGKLMNGLDKIFLPLFFHEFSKNQDSLGFMNGLSDWAAFHYGAKLGSHLGSIPVVGPLTKVGGKIAGGMVFGVGALLLKKEGVDLISDGRRSFWRYAFQKDDGAYTNGKNVTAHRIVNWGIPETLVDGGNNILGSDTDIGIKGRPELQRWIPEMTMFQRKVNMGTAPWEWLGQSQGRNINEWNSGVELMKQRMSERLGDLLRAYQNKEGVFGDKNFIQKIFGMDDSIDRAGGREKLFIGVLKEILVADGTSGYFGDQVYGIMTLVENELKKNPKYPNFNSLLDGIINEIDIMRIDKESMELQESMLEVKKQELSGNIEKLKPHISDEKFRYISLLFDRMLKNQELCAPGKWVVSGGNKNWIPSRENELFQGTLDDSKKLRYDGNKNLVRDIGGAGKSMEIGEYFALLLDMMVNIKKEQEFIKEVKSGNMMGIKWSTVKEDTINLGVALTPKK